MQKDTAVSVPLFLYLSAVNTQIKQTDSSMSKTMRVQNNTFPQQREEAWKTKHTESERKRGESLYRETGEMAFNLHLGRLTL